MVISANGKEEKIASGLLNPFLAHLKSAQEQMAKGGYSIVLEPEPGSDSMWFTKGTVERYLLLCLNLVLSLLVHFVFRSGHFQELMVRTNMSGAQFLFFEFHSISLSSLFLF